MGLSTLEAISGSPTCRLDRPALTAARGAGFWTCGSDLFADLKGSCSVAFCDLKGKKGFLSNKKMMFACIFPTVYCSVSDLTLQHKCKFMLHIKVKSDLTFLSPLLPERHRAAGAPSSPPGKRLLVTGQELVDKQQELLRHLLQVLLSPGMESPREQGARPSALGPREAAQGLAHSRCSVSGK